MKLISIVFVTCFLTNTVLSQNSKNKEQVYDKLFTKTETPPKFSGSLLNYFDSVFVEAELPNNGRVIIEVIIDSIGASHYKRLIDHTNGDEVSNLKLKPVIDKMPAWSPAYQNGHAVNFILILLLDFTDEKLIEVADRSISEEMRYMLNSNKP